MLIESLLEPVISPSTQAFFRSAYGVLLLITLLLALPQRRRYFLTDRYGGYTRSDPGTDRIQNPALMPLILVVWIGCAILLIVGQLTVLAAAVNVVLSYYFFISMRWRSILRGMGAPGFMTYWLGGCVLLLEYSQQLEPTGILHSVVLLTAKVDLAAILLVSGVYKLLAGYDKNEGMHLGMANPMWGFFWQWYRNTPPTHLLYRLLNHSSYLIQTATALFMFVPLTQPLGALLLIVTFVFVGTQIRLWVLSEMMVLAGFIYFAQGSAVDRLIETFVAAPTIGAPIVSVPPAINAAIAVLLVAYLLLLPLAYAGLWHNFLARRRLKEPLQNCLERYTNLFGIILWRVFSADLVDFFIRIYIVDPATGERTLRSSWGSLRGGPFNRYSQVGEQICVCSLFTTLKYYPSNAGLFQERLMRYAKTVPGSDTAPVLFEYVSLRGEARRFAFVTVAEYMVDVARGTITERILDEQAPIRRGHAGSPIYEGATPGSYAPLVRAE